MIDVERIEAAIIKAATEAILADKALFYILARELCKDANITNAARQKLDADLIAKHIAAKIIYYQNGRYPNGLDVSKSEVAQIFRNAKEIATTDLAKKMREDILHA